MMLSEDELFPKSIHKAKGLRQPLDPALETLRLRSCHCLICFKQLTCIRSLNLPWSSIKEIPYEVGKLIHLRHLNLAYCLELESLPETTCDLCNLQSLDVTFCRSLKELPRAIGKLIKLRHLGNDGSGVDFIPKGIERITCLRTLEVFTVCGGGGENESKAANLRELKDLNHIGGSLEIRNLGGGKEDASDAAEAQLKNKKRLLRLELYFNHNQDNGILIEALQPPSDLEYLTIDGYGGLELPNWMMTLTRLQGLKLFDCENLEVLPPLGRLPNLESPGIELVEGEKAPCWIFRYRKR
nr:putative disease resistance protein RGA1 [Populus alba]